MASYTTTAFACSEFERKAIKRRFSAYDYDSSGFIDREEFTSFCEDVGMHDASLRLFAFESCDTDGSGRISLDEFIRWWSEGGSLEMTTILPDMPLLAPPPTGAAAYSTAPPKLSVVSPCVFLYVTQTQGEIVSFRFDVECAKMRSVDLRIHFDESTNLVVTSRHKDAKVSKGELKLYDIPPFTRVTVMTLSADTKMSPWALRYETRVREKSPPTDNSSLMSYLGRVKESDERKIESECTEMERLVEAHGLDIGSSPASTFVEALSSSATKFIDIDFPPVNSSVVSDREVRSSGALGSPIELEQVRGLYYLSPHVTSRNVTTANTSVAVERCGRSLGGAQKISSSTRLGSLPSRTSPPRTYSRGFWATAGSYAPLVRSRRERNWSLASSRRLPMRDCTS